ncbi:mucin-4 isoform X2 [Neodiprion virginianus]|uniref:mucin-4 isoform X2 n=1 Tax=Neodiprion virginianus TaxID=2961670 RepID=UPI001EE6BEEE|nr:mucin-4 isoform X2 [Neodiprion virginianus]
MDPNLFTLLCLFAAIVASVRCKTKGEDDDQRGRLPELLTELDLASVEASQEDVESLKTVVKRLAPAKNGEYLMYQVFFGNEDLLKEWLKGAGVMGQPGVDFPVLTTIPATKFSCRGVKGGYYADPETNCQVFHICDNGRKISFLCPNGTVFQQSQLICDWWFKVDCGKSPELYEQSAEQLAEDDRKRAEAKKMNSEFHRASGKNIGQVYYQTQNQNVDYDGRQNGRTNPFGQNQEAENESGEKNSQQIGRNGNQFSQQQQSRGSQSAQTYNFNQQGDTNIDNQQNVRQNFNTRTGQAKQGVNFQDHFGVTSNSNAPRDEKVNYRNPKAFGESRNNFNELTTTASPFREYQQPAESAAFATSRNNRYNKAFQYNQFNSFYSPNQVSSTEGYKDAFGQNGTPQKAPFPTFAPIFVPRTTSTTPAPYLETTTQRAYVNTDAYRYNTATQTPYLNPQTASSGRQQSSETTVETYTQGYTQATNFPSTQRPYVNTDTYRLGGSGGTATEASTTWSSFDQTTSRHSAAFTTEGTTLTTEPFNSYQSPVTGKSLSPYDTSFTYKYGKIGSTIGPYVPFTKNYAYSTTMSTSTSKPPVYTATVPTIPDQTRTGAGHEIAETEREHAIDMLHSLQELEATAPTTGVHNGTRDGLSIPPSSGPATLHTLALYFATAGDSNFDSNETSTDTAVRIGDGEGEAVVTTEKSASAELPTNLLTQNTVKSYSDLFNINSAIQAVEDVTTNTRLAEEDDPDNDLDLQQSQGPVSGTNQRKNNPKLRELAQVFTHALSAYLQDPETFRKVLTEIRPTEPPTSTGSEFTESTTVYPTTQDEYPSATKEKDEVLDFSDVTKTSRRKKLTTPYPATTQTLFTPAETTYQTLYTTPGVIDESLNEAQSSDFRSSNDEARKDIAQEVNHAFRSSRNDGIFNYNSEASGPSAPATADYDSYVPIGAVESRNRFGGFQNNSALTHSPYGQGVKPEGVTPIGDGYVPEMTPASYDQVQTNLFADYGNVDNFVITPEPIEEFGTEESTTTNPTSFAYQDDNELFTTTRRPFRINYYDTTTRSPRHNDESLATAGSAYSTYSNSFNDLWSGEKSPEPQLTTTTTDYPSAGTTLQTENGPQKYTQQPSTTHWTASPTVTRLWETTVFFDPKRINQGLTGLGEDAVFGTTTPTPSQETLATDSSQWRWSQSENDSPTAFTLLPTTYSENTATPSPSYTTHSSIVTTITSSVSSATSPSLSVSALNVTENEVIRAQEIFGALNSTSSSRLMRVMKQADNNSTVRQLVLLLISHCKGPMNKTMEQERQQLLDALLRTPVNDFSSQESRDIVNGISNLRVSTGSGDLQIVDTTTPVSVTTFRSRMSRKFRPTTDPSEADNSLSIEAESPADNRALELLRSLYTIAAKWG